jgi:hypothetical protein
MRVLLLLGVLGLLALALVPAAERVGAAAGWLAGMALELVTLRARLRARRDGAALLPVLVGGFLARLTLLLGGTLLMHFARLGSAVAFLVACATALLVGEGSAFARLGRPGGPPDSPSRP